MYVMISMCFNPTDGIFGEKKPQNIFNQYMYLLLHIIVLFVNYTAINVACGINFDISK